MTTETTPISRGLIQFLLGLLSAAAVGYVAVRLTDSFGGLVLLTLVMIVLGGSLARRVRFRWLGWGVLTVFACAAAMLIALLVWGSLYASSVDEEDEGESSAPAVLLDRATLTSRARAESQRGMVGRAARTGEGGDGGD